MWEAVGAVRSTGVWSISMLGWETLGALRTVPPHAGGPASSYMNRCCRFWRTPAAPVEISSYIITSWKERASHRQGGVALT